MNPATHANEITETPPAGRLALWLLERFRRIPRAHPRLALLERISVAPRQTLALVEADGRRFLVATSPEGAPTFYALDGSLSPARPVRSTRSGGSSGRVSW